MHLDMFGVILYFFLSSVIGHILYFVLERLLNYPLLTPLRQLGFEHLIREDLSSTTDGRRTAFVVNVTAIPVLFFHATATVLFPWYALTFAIAGLFTTWRMTLLTIMYGRARDQVAKAHAWLDSCRVYAFVLAVGISTMSTINRMNPFSNWTIKINRASAETYGIITIFGIATGIYYLAKKFYVKKENKLVPQSGKQSRNQAAINLGLMVLSFVAFSDFRIWKQFSEWMRLQGYASTVFGTNQDVSCKNYSEKKKPKGCSATEFGPSLCHGCCATEAEALAVSKISVVKFDEESIMANPPSYFPILAKQIIRNPKEIPEWFLKLPKYLQQAIFDGFYETRNIQDQSKAKLTLEAFLAKRFFVKYLSKSNVWTLMPIKLDSPQSDSDSDSFDDVKTPESVPHCGGLTQVVDAGIEIDMQDIPQVNLEDEFPLLKRIPKVLTAKVGFLVAMALLAYGIYLYNRKEEPSEDKYVPPSRRTREDEHKVPSSLYQRPLTGREEHRGKVTFRQQNTKQEKVADRQRRGYVADSNTSDEENSPERWYKRFKAALSKYYVLYDSNDLESILKDGGITMFGVGGNAEVQMVVARNILEFNNYTARGYYCDPTIMRPISKGRVIFTNDAKGIDVDTSILQDIARGKPVRANAMQKLSELLQDEDIILDASAQALVDSYHRIDASWFGPRNPDTQIPNTPYSRKGKPENAEIKPTATKDKPPVILKRPSGLNNKLEEMTGKNLDRTCCTDERLCPSCVDKLSYRKAALATSTPPVITDLMDAALNDFGECASVPEAWWLPRISNQGALGPDAPNGCVHYCGKATSDSTACCDFDCEGEKCSHWAECNVWKVIHRRFLLQSQFEPKPESSTADASNDKVCPFDGRTPGCRQIDCKLEHPTRQPIPEALNGYHYVSHFPEKLTTNYLAFINLRNPNDGSLVKYGTCYVTHSHLSTAAHVFKTRDGQNIPLENLTVQFPGSEEQYVIALGSLHSIPYSLELNPPYAGEQVRFKLVKNEVLAQKTTAPVGIPVVGETIYILSIRGKEHSPWPIESKIEEIKDGLLWFSSNNQSGDSGGPVVSARTGSVIGTYWGLSTDPKLNLAIANCSEQLPFYASGQILKQNFSHPSLRVTSQWRGIF